MEFKVVFETKSVVETQELGEKLGSLLSKGDLVALKGDLGAGKTAFARGITRGVGSEDFVTSPTFTIINEYGGDVPVAHIDVYRLSDAGELEEIGFRDYLKEYVVIIEWADLVIDILPEEILWVELETIGEQERRIIFTAKGKKYEKILQEMKKS
ncbi:tRNA threonylcarbamoyladenosine biosynthesis protein TsaE [Caldanaerovirga acetigignens]|uniref:tRNA threonylcarbamoyladenosine biosynthesis protein TsaE n=1 Tax=Caldanaerovirga acetigignens TaxID=447595 RepID=A0A1M7HPR2_9FIRM|nr:tRNA (adenosine(37)-N6)-threonylcarbamoyltransferase complex ATPase subunit type 1 TsaE [Caldanaerovirga acetigignens]SHM30117.1 tRNA threonylcarbamoyladenosine biosynthesis protein TsaE [Caldanaerovirga acetigignens]